MAKTVGTAAAGKGHRTALLAALTALAFASLTGCKGDSSGVVIGASGTAGPAASGTSSEPTATQAPTQVQPVLSDTGFGDLELGMSLEQAQELGFAGKLAQPNDTVMCNQYHGKQGLEYLYFTEDQLIIIVPGPRVRLDTGFGVGSAYADVKYAYGDRLDSRGAKEFSRITISAPDAPFPAHYRMDLDFGTGVEDSTIATIAIQSDDQTCYE